MPPQPLREVQDQAVHPVVRRYRPCHALAHAPHGRGFGRIRRRPAGRCEHEEVREQSRPGTAQTLGVEVVRSEAGDDPETVPRRTERIEQESLATGAAERTEPV